MRFANVMHAVNMGDFDFDELKLEEEFSALPADHNVHADHKTHRYPPAHHAIRSCTFED